MTGTKRDQDQDDLWVRLSRPLHRLSNGRISVGVADVYS